MISKAEQLFTAYLALGEGRTLAKLAQATGKSESYLENLSSKHKWKSRVLADTQIIVDDIQAFYRDRKSEELVAKLSLAERVYKKIEENVDNVPVETSRDVKVMLEVYALLTGKPTVISQDVTTLPVEKMTDEELARLSELLAQAE